ncbi:hypothetical protein Sjap_005610 [Stephania japonica]|uniref:Uncharacterized protein n=1 Tax=Stephania japonica TaxID=461633 RepID=A0AAP0K4H1_9MAGN
MTLLEVYWDNTLRGSPPVSEITFNNKPLKYLNIVEPYNLDWVMRQIGYVQSKLKDPFRPINADRSSLAKSYSVKYTFDAQFWEDWEDNVISVGHRGKKVGYPSQATNDYVDWFHSVSHPFAYNPKFVSVVVHEDEPTLMLLCGTEACQSRVLCQIIHSKW